MLQNQTWNVYVARYDEKRLKEDHSGEALEKLKQSFNEGSPCFVKEMKDVRMKISESAHRSGVSICFEKSS